MCVGPLTDIKDQGTQAASGEVTRRAVKGASTLFFEELHGECTRLIHLRLNYGTGLYCVKISSVYVHRARVSGRETRRSARPAGAAPSLPPSATLTHTPPRSLLSCSPPEGLFSLPAGVDSPSRGSKLVSE
ncbi:hypothetical protein E2C01_013046 [Portunus trituberculatus]|uniref:Uncharacterized protein n=1 Tax=Portunus trituberculatus TaxID=210409 RepID=A0A5B7DFY5_PORTR|nr:hypothetical protein [Portunus trituberculatus]